MRSIYWDSVLIQDNALPRDLFEKLKKDAYFQNDLKEGIVDNTDPDKTSYLFSEDHTFDYLDEWIGSTDIIPRLDHHDQSWAVRHHLMTKGGKMAWHSDASYSIAVTIYLNSCEGGELQIQSQCGTQGIIVCPIENRAVVIKCDQRHCVLPVLGGDRHSIQVFIKYSEQTTEVYQNGYLGNH